MRNILGIGIGLFVSSSLIACADDGGTPTTQGTGSETGASTDGEEESGTTQDAGETAAEASTTGEQTTGGDVEPTSGMESGTTMVEEPDGSGSHCVNPGSEILPVQSGLALVETITLAGTGKVGDLDVGLKISGTLTVQLTMRLSHGGTTIELSHGICESNSDFDVTFDDEGPPLELACCTDIFMCQGDPLVGVIPPSEALAGFDGLPIEGDWTLEIDVPNYEPEMGNWGVLDELCMHIALP